MEQLMEEAQTLLAELNDDDSRYAHIYWCFPGSCHSTHTHPREHMHTLANTLKHTRTHTYTHTHTHTHAHIHTCPCATAIHCNNTLQHQTKLHNNTLAQHTATTHCNNTATAQCNKILQHTNRLQHTAAQITFGSPGNAHVSTCPCANATHSNDALQ